ncbi:MAG: hypothetical protein ACHQFX_15725 [Chitinophagales bacterium]
MKLFLLDAGGAGLVFVALIIFIIIAITTEAITMLLMKYNRAGKAFLDSFVANMASLVAGFILSSVAGTVFDITPSIILNWLILYVLTVLVEFVVLYFLNRTSTPRKTFIASAVMNFVSYIILYFFVGGG